MGAQVHGELAGVAAGVGADLALEGPLVRVDAQVLVEAAAVGGRVVTALALVGLHARVAAHVRLQLVLAAEALAADLTLVGLVAFKQAHAASGNKMKKEKGLLPAAFRKEEGRVTREYFETPPQTSWMGFSHQQTASGGGWTAQGAGLVLCDDPEGGVVVGDIYTHTYILYM